MNTCSFLIILICLNQKPYPFYDCMYKWYITKHPFHCIMGISYNNIRYNIKRISFRDAGCSTFYTWRCCCRTQNMTMSHLRKTTFPVFYGKISLSSMFCTGIMWHFMHDTRKWWLWDLYFFSVPFTLFPMFALKFRLWWLFKNFSRIYLRKRKMNTFQSLKHFYTALLSQE